MQPHELTAPTAELEIAYEEGGRETGSPIILLHGFPYDVRQYDAIRDGLASELRSPCTCALPPWFRAHPVSGSTCLSLRAAACHSKRCDSLA